MGLRYLRALHLNDSKGDLGCRLDRHENIGRGKIGTVLWNVAAFGLPFLLSSRMRLSLRHGRNLTHSLVIGKECFRFIMNDRRFTGTVAANVFLAQSNVYDAPMSLFVARFRGTCSLLCQ